MLNLIYSMILYEWHPYFCYDMLANSSRQQLLGVDDARGAVCVFTIYVYRNQNSIEEWSILKGIIRQSH